MSECKDCKFYSPDGPHSGNCHRFPPVYLTPTEESFHENSGLFDFPAVGSFHFCGEFKAKGEFSEMPILDEYDETYRRLEEAETRLTKVTMQKEYIPLKAEIRRLKLRINFLEKIVGG